MEDKNMELWSSVRTPDPAFTKSFSRSGGFKGTATNAVYLIQRATELWGPCGGAWGVTVVDEKIIDGAPLMIDEQLVGCEKVHCIRIELRHPSGVVPGIGQTTMVGKNKNGFFTDEEAPKKSLTDALTKALSWLGFAADIHLGLWDDNKYVNDVREQFREGHQDGHSRGGQRLINTKQALEIERLLADSGTDLSMFLTWISDKAGYLIDGISAIPADAYQLVTKALKKRTTEGAANG